MAVEAEMNPLPWSVAVVVEARWSAMERASLAAEMERLPLRWISSSCFRGESERVDLVPGGGAEAQGVKQRLQLDPEEGSLPLPTPARLRGTDAASLAPGRGMDA
jgi:hypothetical protein